MHENIFGFHLQYDFQGGEGVSTVAVLGFEPEGIGMTLKLKFLG